MVRKISLAVLAAAMTGLIVACGGGGRAGGVAGRPGGSSQEVRSVRRRFDGGGTAPLADFDWYARRYDRRRYSSCPVEPGRPVIGTNCAPDDLRGRVDREEASYSALSILRAPPPQSRVEIGSETNAQDMPVLGARWRMARRSATVATLCAIIQDSQVGDFAFGRVQRRDHKLGRGTRALVLHGATVENS